MTKFLEVDPGFFVNVDAIVTIDTCPLGYAQILIIGGKEPLSTRIPIGDMLTRLIKLNANVGKL